MDKPIVFSDDELFKALNKSLGLEEGEGESLLEHKPSPDPGTITAKEFGKRHGLGRTSTNRELQKAIDAGILYRDKIKRYDRWPPHGLRATRGYRYRSEKETGLDKQ